MRKPKPDGITVRCIGCKRKLLISFEEAARMTEPPTCHLCLLPMVAIEVAVTT